MSKNKKTTLVICPFATPNIGGVETHLDKMIKELVKKDYYVHLLTYQPLTTDSIGEKDEYGDGYEIHRMKWFGMNWFPKLEKYFPLVFAYLFTGLFIKSFFYYLKKHKEIDVIHAHGLAAVTIAVILKLFIKKRRVVLSTHAIYNFGDRKVLSFFIKVIMFPVDKILAVSKVAQKEFIEVGLPKEKVSVFRYWVDDVRFKPVEYNKKLLRLGPKLNILYVGRLIKLKGIEHILDVAKELPDVTFHIVGTGPLREKVEKAALGKNIVYHGVLMQSSSPQLEKLAQLYSACDYFLSPYLYDEGFGITLLESLFCGTPVIVPRRGTPPTFLSKEVAEFLPGVFTKRDILKLLKALNKKTDIKKKNKRSMNCREFVLENFSPRNITLITDAYALE